MSRFQECLAVTLKFEGGYSNADGDHGGETNFGITSTEYDAWRAKQDLPLQSVRLISADEVSAIYEVNYWDVCKCSSLPAPVDLVVFDSAVNCGPGHAVKFLQQALSVDVDGIIGPKTLAALDGVNAADVASACLDYRDKRYHEIVAEDPTQTKFLDGWLNRDNSLRKML